MWVHVHTHTSGPLLLTGILSPLNAFLGLLTASLWHTNKQYGGDVEQYLTFISIYAYYY